MGQYWGQTTSRKIHDGGRSMLSQPFEQPMSSLAKRYHASAKGQDGLFFASNGDKPRPEQEQEQKQKQEQKQEHETDYSHLPKIRVYYLRPAIWAVAISAGIFINLSYLSAKHDLAQRRPRGRNAPCPCDNAPRAYPPSISDTATQWWASINPMTKLGAGIIAANTVVHAGSFVAPQLWDMLWHMPARNVNYTQFTSMFVHSGGLHFFINMYFLNNFIAPVGYSRLFEGNPYHVLSFFLSAGVLSGFAQHWATLIPKPKSPPEIFMRFGGASGALFGVLGAFCMQYPDAGLGVLFVPVHFDAQYVLPAIMLFDLVGMIRGYSFVNFGHAAHLSGALIGVAYSFFDGKTYLWKPLVNYWKLQLQ